MLCYVMLFQRIQVPQNANGHQFVKSAKFVSLMVKHFYFIWFPRAKVLVTWMDRIILEKLPLLDKT